MSFTTPRLTRKRAKCVRLISSGIVRKLLRALTAAGNTQLVERSNDFFGAPLASATDCGEPGLQCRIGGIDAKADDVQRVAAPRYGDLNTVDEIQPVELRRGSIAAASPRRCRRDR